MKTLTIEQKEAWVSFYVAHVAVTREIDRRMEAAGAVTLDVYGVLLALEESENHRLRMSNLADAVFLSKSGLTRLVDRLERDGLLCRKACAKDRRALYAVLTDQGLEARSAAWPIYQDAICELFASKMSSDEAELVAHILRRMTGTCKCYGSKTP